MGKKIAETEITFLKRIRVDGNYCANFIFKNEKEMIIWIDRIFPKLNLEYDNTLTFKIIELDGLKVGDKCQVIGEGTDIFQIEKLIKYCNYKYSFGLDSGWTEEVSKCYKIQDD